MNIMNHGQLPTQTMAAKKPRNYILLGIVNWKYVTYEHMEFFFYKVLLLEDHKVAVLLNWLL